MTEIRNKLIIEEIENRNIVIFEMVKDFSINFKYFNIYLYSISDKMSVK